MATSVCDASRLSAVEGCLLGLSVGDSIGLPYEGLAPGRAQAMARLPERPRHRLLFGKGLVSDDTDHAVFCAQALMLCDRDPSRFAAELKKRLRWWVATIPAGAGMATLKAGGKMWLGIKDSAIDSAGNGAAMRAPLLGAALCDDELLRRAVVEASTRATHRDPRALASALAISELCARGARGDYASARPSPSDIQSAMTHGVKDPAWIEAAARARDLLERGAGPQDALVYFGDKTGASGFCMRSVPMAIFLWARNWGDFEAAIAEAISVGGDVDTVCAMVGGLAGSAWGKRAVPSDWIEGVVDAPHGPAELSRLARALCGLEPAVKLGFSFWLFARSPLFMALVLAHGFRRALPPYAKRGRA